MKPSPEPQPTVNEILPYHKGSLPASTKKQPITATELKNLGWKGGTTAMVCDLNRVRYKYNITSLEDRRQFIAQCSVESAYGRYTQEIDSGAYLDGNKGLGNTQKGDGPKFKGAGYIQLTGRNAYTAFSKAMGDPAILSKGPSYVAQYYPWESAGWFWSKHTNINQRVLAGASVTTVTKLVNGGTNGLSARTAAYDSTKKYIKK